MGKYLKRFLSLILAAVLVASCLPVPAHAEEMEETAAVSEPMTEETAQTKTTVPAPAVIQETPITFREESVIPDISVLPSDEELFSAYAAQVLYGTDMATFGIAAGNRLTGDEKLAYDALKPWIQKVACGEVTSTVVAIGYAHENINVSGTDQTNYPVDIAVPFATTSLDMNALLDALLADIPCELYWFDKTAGIQVWSLPIPNGLYVRMSFSVSADYASARFAVNQEKTGVLADVTQNAQSVVSAASSLSDYDKLIRYRDYLTEKASYDTDAAYGGRAYGDPWQLIRLFDNDGTNNQVVCEGYSKAFQYLCDLTVFRSEVTCYSVTGTMGGGDHMWNVVDINGARYLVDITNSDANTIGERGGLFLVGGKTTGTNTYTFLNIDFVYDRDTVTLWSGTDVLTLATEDYVPGTEEEPLEPEEPDAQADLEAQLDNCVANGLGWDQSEAIRLSKDLTIRVGAGQTFTILEGGIITVPAGITLTLESPVDMAGGKILVEQGGKLILKNQLQIFDGVVYLPDKNHLEKDGDGSWSGVLTFGDDLDPFLAFRYLKEGSDGWYDTDETILHPIDDWQFADMTTHHIIVYVNQWDAESMEWHSAPVVPDLSGNGEVTLMPIHQWGGSVSGGAMNPEYLLMLDCRGAILPQSLKLTAMVNGVSCEAIVTILGQKLGFYSAPEAVAENYLTELQLDVSAAENVFYLIPTDSEAYLDGLTVTVHGIQNGENPIAWELCRNTNIWKFTVDPDYVASSAFDQNTLSLTVTGNIQTSVYTVEIDILPAPQMKPQAIFWINGYEHRFYDNNVVMANLPTGSYDASGGAVMALTRVTVSGVAYDVRTNTLLLDGAKLSALQIRYRNVWYDAAGGQHTDQYLPDANLTVHLKNSNYIEAEETTAFVITDGACVTVTGEGTLILKALDGDALGLLSGSGLTIGDRATIRAEVTGSGLYENKLSCVYAENAVLTMKEDAALVTCVPENGDPSHYCGIRGVKTLEIRDFASLDTDSLVLRENQILKQSGGVITVRGVPNAADGREGITLQPGASMAFSGGMLTADGSVVNNGGSIAIYSGGKVTVNALLDNNGNVNVLADGSLINQGIIMNRGGEAGSIPQFICSSGSYSAGADAKLYAEYGHSGVNVAAGVPYVNQIALLNLSKVPGREMAALKDLINQTRIYAARQVEVDADLTVTESIVIPEDMALTVAEGILVTVTEGATVTNAGLWQGLCGDSLAWKMKGDILDIAGSGALVDAPWNALAPQIVKIHLDEGITGIGGNAFSGCVNASVTIPENVTEIKVGAFEDVGMIRYYHGTKAEELFRGQDNAAAIHILNSQGYCEAAGCELQQKTLSQILTEDTDAAVRAETVRTIAPESIRAQMEKALETGGSLPDEIRTLEKELISRGINVSAKVHEDAAAEIREAFSDVDGSCVTGAVLNAKAGTSEVTLIIDDPQKDHRETVDETTYNTQTSLLFSLSMTGVEDASALAVPVAITLPVPGTLDADVGLQLIHYPQNDAPEKVDCRFHRDAAGKAYITFVAAGFSNYRLSNDRIPVTLTAQDTVAALGSESANILIRATDQYGEPVTDLEIGYYLLNADNERVELAEALGAEGIYTICPTYIAQGKYHVTEKPGVLTVKLHCEAQIRDREYATLKAALEAAEANDTILLLAYPREDILFDKTVTVDLNGLDYTIRCANGFTAIDCGNGRWSVLTVNDCGTIDSMTATLSLENVVRIEIGIKAYTGFDGIDLSKNMGLLMWEEGSDVTAMTAVYDHKDAVRLSDVSFEDGRYWLRSAGIPAKQLGDEFEMRVYVDLGDGRYAYSKLFAYSAEKYAYNAIKNANNQTLAAVVKAMLNYGSAAQVNFGYKTNELVNAGLTDAERTMQWDPSILDAVEPVDAAKVGNMIRDTEVFTKRSATLSLMGAVNIEYRLGIAQSYAQTAQEIGILYWSAATHAAVETLSEENADVKGCLTYDGNTYSAEYENVSVKDLGRTVYACAYLVDSEGEYHYSGVMAYSIERYIANADSNADGNVKNVVRWLAIYGEYARQYFY